MNTFSRDKNYRILIVDDNIDAATTLSLLMECLGFEVTAVNDGLAGVAATHTFRPHILLLDIGMPVMDGFEVATTLRADPKTCDVGIIGCSAWNDAETRQREHQAGFDGHVTKPASPYELCAEIGRVLTHRRI